MTLVNTSVSGNAARGTPYDDEGFGGGIYNNGTFGSATATINNSALEYNSANIGGGGVFNIGNSGDAMLTITDSRVSNNGPTSNGGGIFNWAFSSDPDRRGNAHVILTNTVVNGNGGGGIANWDSFELDLNVDGGNATLTITNSDLSDNHAGSGGAISSVLHSVSSSVTITDSTILRNRAEGDGGGLFNAATTDGRSTMTISNSTIRGNSSRSRGGGIFNGGNAGLFAVLTIDKSTVSDNSSFAGGGIYNSGSFITAATATVTNSTLSGNSAQGDPASPLDPYTPGGGGAVFNGSNFFGTSRVDLTNCTLSGNSTQYTGGAILNYVRSEHFGIGQVARVTLNNCTFSGNSAAQGGGSIWNEVEPVEGYPPGRATLDIANTIFNAGALGGNIQNLLGIVTSPGYNLSSDGAGGDGTTGPGGLLNGPGDIRNTDPLLGPLQNNGGPTRTNALLLNSPAINAGDPNFNPNAFVPPLLYDQRGLGFLRVVNGRIDIGAFEWRHP